MKAPFGRIGGKSKLAKQIISRFPSDYNTYVEAFVGAGNIYFRIPNKVDNEIINDLDEDVYLIMNALKTDNDNINKNIKRTNITKEYYNSIRESKDPLRIYEGVKMGFFADRRRGYGFNDKNKNKIVIDLAPYEERLKDTIILNKPYDEVIKEYDSPSTFFYLDPPYENTTKSDYKDYVNPLELYETIKNIKGKFLLSYNDSPNIREIFKDYTIEEVTTSYSHTQNIKDREKKELLIYNY